jgi:hypothetical protein
MSNNQITAVINRDLSYTMRSFLDNRKGKDLILSVHEFAEYFQLSPEKASELVQIWMDLP